MNGQIVSFRGWRFGTSLLVGVGIVFMVACAGSAGASGPGGSGAAGPGGVGDASSVSIVVATDRGVELIDTTGKVLKRISPTPARRPRLTGDGHLVFMAKGFAELRRVKLDGTGERPMAVIPPTVASECDTSFPAPWDPALLLRSDEAMQVDRKSQAVCMHLTAGDDDSSSAWLRIDLPKAGPGSGTLGLICGAAPPPADFQCDDGGRAGESGSKPAGKYQARDGAIVERASGQVLRELAGAKLEEVAWAATGPWSLIIASVKDGTFVHRSALAFDRESGQVFEIAPGEWPEPISDKRWRALGQGAEVSRSVAVQSDIRALGHDGLFVVDTLLIVPGRRVVDTRGQFAR